MRGPSNDLTAQEQTNVRFALRYLRARFHGWHALAKALRFTAASVKAIGSKHPVSASMAFRVARLIGISIDDLLAGKAAFPNCCPTCGAPTEGDADAAH